MTRLGLIRQCLSNNLALWLSLTVAFAVFYYLLLMAALIIRFESLPNYLNAYDWSFNIRRIWLSTPSILDSVTIMKDEWLFEVGFMNMTTAKVFQNGVYLSHRSKCRRPFIDGRRNSQLITVAWDVTVSVQQARYAALVWPQVWARRLRR